MNLVNRTVVIESCEYLKILNFPSSIQNMKFFLPSTILLLLPLIGIAKQNLVEPSYKIIFHQEKLSINATNVEFLKFHFDESIAGHPLLRFSIFHHDKCHQLAYDNWFGILNNQNQTFINGSFVIESKSDSDHFYKGCYKSEIPFRIFDCYGDARLRRLNELEELQMKMLADTSKSGLHDYHVLYKKGSFISKQVKLTGFTFQYHEDSVRFELYGEGANRNTTINLQDNDEFELLPE